ncbi:hypothetical protein QQ045_015045 [Rhodiola kirilowii]
MSESVKTILVIKLLNGMSFNLTGLSKIWNKAEFKELANNMALVEFEKEIDKIRIKEGGPWHCLNTTVVLHDWCPDLTPKEIKMTKLGVWAQLHNLPIGVVMYDKEVAGIKYIYIGRFVKTRKECAPMESAQEIEISSKVNLRVAEEPSAEPNLKHNENLGSSAEAQQLEQAVGGGERTAVGEGVRLEKVHGEQESNNRGTAE